ncbi:MAG TPA: hypothetical protein VFY71_01665 [Planctomycetota bacterium]|nr:hypothetical protein [Planctomycetota bacterium]
MLRLLCLALLLPACASTPRFSANFESEPTGPLPWATDSDVGWVRYDPQGGPPGDALKIDPLDAGQISVIPAGPLPTQALRITAPGGARPVSLRALPSAAPIGTGTVTVSFAGRFEAPASGFSPKVQWIMVATDSTDEVLGGLQLSSEAGAPVLTYGGREFFYTDPDQPAANPLQPFALRAQISPATRTLELTFVSDGKTIVDGEKLELSPTAASDVAALVFWGNEGSLILDDVQIWQD